MSVCLLWYDLYVNQPLPLTPHNLPTFILPSTTQSYSDETAMSANQAQGIIEYMPTLAERKSLRDYMKTGKNGETAAKSFERLCECEKFMVAMMTVKQSKRKIRALLFKLQFRGCIHDLAHGELMHT